MPKALFTRLPGECAYSVVARAYLGSPYLSWKQTNREVFHRVNIRLNAMLSGHLNDIAQLIDCSEIELVLSGTCHSLVAFGLADKRRVVKLIREQYTGHGSSAYHSSRLAGAKLAFGNYLKSCPECIKQDEAQHGVAYWHTLHQYHGMVTCPEHGLKLNGLCAGERGLDHSYVLPEYDERQMPVMGNHAEQYLSKYLAALHHYLNEQSPLQSMSELHRQWLDAKGYLTPNGNVRVKLLKPIMQCYWRELYAQVTPALPLELFDCGFISRLVHRGGNVHYIKHVLLMAFLTESPAMFFRGPQREAKPVVIKAKPGPNVKPSVVVALLEKGLSMRDVAKQLKCSVGFVKQAALKHGVEVERRRQRISVAIERSIWRCAVHGQHRADIARRFGVSVGAVEVIIQSHAGLSQWRRHLRRANKRRAQHALLQEYLAQHPQCSRNQAKKNCPAYMWLYKHDNEWLYAQLPPPKNVGLKPEFNWPARDEMTLAKLRLLNGDFRSMSAIDRAIGGLGWLVKLKAKFPRSYQYAQSLLRT